MPPDPHGIGALARAAGLHEQWTDADGMVRTVADDDLAAILDALGHTADDEASRRRSHDRLAHEASLAPRFLSGDMGRAIPLPASLASAAMAEIVAEDGVANRIPIAQGHLPAIPEPGYYRLHIQGHELTLAVAPDRCAQPAQAPLWGAALQIPALRGRGAYGSLDDLKDAATAFARQGADLLAISPLHAVSITPGTPYSPYSPSSRIALNASLALAPREQWDSPLIDWPDALAAARSGIQAAFDALTSDERQALRDWAAQQPEECRRHAIHAAIRSAQGDRPSQHWPEALRNWSAPGVAAFIASHGDAIDLHLFGQMIADQKLAAAQGAARDAGMAIGLIADLAVGVDPSGSDVWANPEAYLRGLTIGAPPDPLGPQGQDWRLTSLSPAGLRAQGFAPWIALLRATLRHAGGMRIDHAFGLQRLWVIPEGGASRQGAYLAYPMDDLLRLLALESHRSGAIAVAEDLGTVPPGFRAAIDARGIYGMSVLWFERDASGTFRPPADYSRHAAAMTGTHDTPTVAGWWQGRDLDWRARLDPDFDLPGAQADRAADRARLWSRTGSEAPAPPVDAPQSVVDGAIAHIAATRSALKILPVEDLLGLAEQVNIPGTTDAHPNWCRRLPAPLSDLLARPETKRRIATLNAHTLDDEAGTRMPLAGFKER